jgi:FKBP-type peptidyl-prolyl cis-trans isomerase
MRSILLISLLTLLFAACGGNQPAEKAPPLPAEQRAAIEARLIGELSPSDDRSGRERNDMINYAIDEIWDVQPAPEGYFYEVLEAGQGEPLMEGDLVSAHYTGRFLDKTTFADSKKSRRKLDFFVGQMIPAWNLALPSIKPGGHLRLLVPSELAYGADGLVNGRGDTLVAAHRALVFELSEIEVKERALEREW